MTFCSVSLCPSILFYVSHPVYHGSFQFVEWADTDCNKAMKLMKIIALYVVLKLNNQTSHVCYLAQFRARMISFQKIIHWMKTISSALMDPKPSTIDRISEKLQTKHSWTFSRAKGKCIISEILNIILDFLQNNLLADASQPFTKFRWPLEWNISPRHMSKNDRHCNEIKKLR